MKWSYAATSMALLMISIFFLVLMTLFESSLSGMPTSVERTVSAFLLVLPGVIGVIFGVLSLLRKEKRPWLAILGIVLNSLFALFHASVLTFAG